ncbi:MAG: hypothetical protein J5687_05470 [Treponema sp.]|nr:hypothetical protein [Treponema sp.]
MKKRFFVLIALCFCFTGCISMKVTEPKEDEISVHIANNCAWELNIKINQIIGFPSSFKLGRNGKTLILKKNKTYIITVDSRLDYKKATFFVKTSDYNTNWRITWDSFDGEYHIYY